MTTLQIRLLIRQHFLVMLLTTVANFGFIPIVHAEDVTLIHAAELHIGNGTIIKQGMVIIKNGRIEKIGINLSTPPGAKKITIKEGSITPGLIDANAALAQSDTYTQNPHQRSAREVLHDLFMSEHHEHPGVGCCGSRCTRSLQHVDGKKCTECGFPNDAAPTAVGNRSYIVRTEDSAEVVPEVRVIDSVNMYSPDFERLVRGGVTTIFVAPDSAAVISAQGAILHTAGSSDQRIIKETDAIKASMGTDPSWRGMGNRRPFRKRVNLHTRRPTTRMGVTWIFRKAMYDTLQNKKGLPVYGADTPSAAAMQALEQVLSGQTPLRIQARTQHDILSAIRLTREFNLPFILEEATEAYRCLDELKENDTPVVYGPIFINAQGHRARSTEVSRARLHTMKALLDAGIETALTAHELRDENGLARQAMYAIRFGVDLADIMRAVTQTPAKILGLDDEIGTIEEGKRADLILWSGQPFEATSIPLVVWINGETVVDRRNG